MVEYSSTFNKFKNGKFSIFLNFEWLEYEGALYSGAITLEGNIQKGYLSLVYEDSWVRYNQGLDLPIGEVGDYLRYNTNKFRNIVEHVTKECMLVFYRTDLNTTLGNLMEKTDV